MEDLAKIKALESDLEAQLRKAQENGIAAVEAQKAAKADVIAKALREAEWEAARMLASEEASAQSQSRDILSKAQDEVGSLRVKHARNRAAAQEHILRQLGV